MSSTVRLTTAQALIRYLQAQHSERDGEVRRVIPALFGIFGHGNVLGIGQAVDQDGAELPLYQPKNEQAMVHTALGYAKASRRLATLACSASIGPGSTNMLTGAATATTNRLPVLLLPSDTFANRRQGPVLQQLEHPSDGAMTVNDSFRPVSRFFDRIARPEQLLTALPAAMRTLLDPAETGAVTISLHQDVQGEAFDWPAELFDHRVWHVARRPPEHSELEAAAAVIRGAERPFVIAGGGVRYSAAESALLHFVERLGIPVAETSAGKGSLSGTGWLVGGVGVNGTRVANELARDADVVVCVGTRLSDFTTASHSLFQHPDVQFVGINTNGADANKLSAAPIVADAREALVALSSELMQTRSPAGYAAAVRNAVQSWDSDLEEDIAARDGQPMGQGEVLAVLNARVSAGDWVVAAAGWQPGDLLKLWRTPRGSFTHIEFAYSCMGHEIPAGLGIRMHEGPGPEVFVVIGDGTFLMNPTELVTSVQEGLKLTVVILDNGGYGSISGLARANTGSSVGNEFRSRAANARLPDAERLAVDHAGMARSMGCEATRAESIEAFTAALVEARAATATTVIVVPTAPDRALLASGAFWDLGVPEVAADPTTAALTSDHLTRRGAQRHY